MAGIAAAAYADAIFSLAQEEHKLDVFGEQLALVGAGLRENEAFARLLAHPKISKEQKKDMLEQVYASALEPLVLNFLRLLVDKGRMGSFSAVCKAYHERYNEAMGIAVAYVKSAVALREEEKDRLRRMLEEKTGKRIELVLREDPSLIAGIRVKIGDQTLDNSVQMRMDRMKARVKASSEWK